MMVEPLTVAILSAIYATSTADPRFLVTMTLRLGRSDEFWARKGCARLSTRAMSSFTASTAVAVSAMSGTSPLGDSWRRMASSERYEGRKSCPHCDRQCASSMAISPSPPRAASSCRRCMKYDAAPPPLVSSPLITPVSFSGVQYTTRYSPCSAASSTDLSRCCDPRNAASCRRPPPGVLLTVDAPAVLLRCVTWSFMSEMSGLTTSVVLPVCSAGSW
mmetsp:Transcript_25192/g.62200  ORF Transcript_25192/g.62200 Transcript_25192/m.62200 type:complete len:218 (-) Transcript_25192:37-690(-)